MRVNIPKFNAIEVGFEPLPPATYTALVTRCELRTGKEKGTKYISWEFTINGPTHTGRKFFTNSFYEKEEQAWTTKRLVVGCGCVFDDNGFATEECVGKTVLLTLGQKPNRMDESKIENTVDKIASATTT